MRSLFRSLVVAAAASMAVAQSTFTNPIIWEDFADLDVFRVNDTFYYSASTMHYSPGAPVLRSYDLVNWEFAGHSVPRLDWGNKYNLPSGSSAYVNGIWASSMRYRKSNGRYYWYGCSDFATTWVYTATDPAGEWSLHGKIGKCFYDLGILVDNDDKIYLAYGSYDINVVELASDGLTIVRDQIVYPRDGRYLEGARFYHIGNFYYIWLTKPANEQHVLKASNPWGPYTSHSVLVNMQSPIPTSGTPHQGAIVDTPNGAWYYMSFLDAYPLGRIPALAPITFDGNGIPKITTGSNGGWGQQYPKPNIQTSKTVTPIGPFTDNFRASKLRPDWEWNHNPDNNAWSLGSTGLTLRTATVTRDLHYARNTLTTRILGPKSSGTFRLNVGSLRSGDRAGIAVLRDLSHFLAVNKRSDGSVSLVLVRGVLLDEVSGQGWRSVSEGTQVTEITNNFGNIANGSADIWLRVITDLTPTFGSSASRNTAQFQYSTDGTNFQNVGSALALHNNWEFFMAFRFAVFNFATSATGGSVLVKEFSLARVS